MRVEPFCPVDSVIDLISSRSSLLILRELFGGPKRTSDLLAAIGISSATLLDHLRSLESSGVVQRVSYPQSPPRVEYQLTEKGWELEPVMIALRDVGDRWQNHSCHDAEKEHSDTCAPCHLNKGRGYGNLRQPGTVSQPVSIKRSNVFML